MVVDSVTSSRGDEACVDLSSYTSDELESRYDGEMDSCTGDDDFTSANDALN